MFNPHDIIDEKDIDHVIVILEGGVIIESTAIVGNDENGMACILNPKRIVVRSEVIKGDCGDQPGSFTIIPIDAVIAIHTVLKTEAGGLPEFMQMRQSAGRDAGGKDSTQNFTNQ